MAILVVGSVAFDTIETPSGRAERCVGGAATHFALAASYFTDVRVIAVVGEDFTGEHEAILTRRGIDTRGIEHTTGQELFLERVLPEESERSADAEHRAECLSELHAENSRRIPGQRVSVSGKHRSCTAGRCSQQDAEGKAGLRRHDELLDQRSSRKPGRAF